MYNFDEIIERRNTNSLKYDFAIERKRPKDILPFWVADMDFKTADEIIMSLENTARHGIFGYSEPKDSYYEALRSWYSKRFSWDTSSYHILKTPGIVFFLSLAIKSLTNENDAVIIQRPVYYPFSEVILLNKRQLINNSLVLKDNHYEIDFEDFENKILENKVKLFILCSPHNPVGRVWTKEELLKLGNICLKHNVYIISDEIHSDFAFFGKHHVISNINDDISNISIVCTSPSKTFNLAGIQISNVFFKNEELYNKLKEEYDKSGYSQLNIFAINSCESAYRHGDKWLDELKVYLINNINYLKEYIKENIPSIKVIDSEGTYLVWLDLRELNLTSTEQRDLIVNKANLWLDHGLMFGSEGKGFERINVACPKVLLKQALENLKDAVCSLSK